MPTSGKPVFNPFTAAAPTQKSAARPDLAEKPARPGLRKKRGISALATEQSLQTLSMKKAAVLSAVLHLFSPVALTILSLLVLLIASWLLHFNFWDWFKPKPTQPDMVFTLVSNTQASAPEKPLFRGNFNQQAGGKHNPKQALKPTEEPPKASQTKPKQASTPPKPAVKPEPKSQPTSTSTAAQPEKPIKPKPTLDKSAPTPTIAKPLESSTKNKPVTQTPQQIDAAPHTQATSTQPASIGKSFEGSDASASTDFNPQTGKSNIPGVDVAADLDYGPYMAEMKMRIQRNWNNVRFSSRKKVVLMFFIGRDGQLMNERGGIFDPASSYENGFKIEQSSGDRDADMAAVEAIKLSAPFKPLPPQEKADVLPIIYTFEYNILNAGSSNRASKR